MKGKAKKSTPASFNADELTVVIETPRGSRNKLKCDASTQKFKLAKVMPEGMVFPYDFGYIPFGPQELYGAAEFRKILIKCLLELQPALSVVFVLRDIEELSISETSEALSLSAVAVKARLFRARLQLREGLSRYFWKRDGLRRSEVAH